MAPLSAVVVVLASGPAWFPVTGLVGLTTGTDRTLGVETQLLYQGGWPVEQGGMARGVTFGVGLRGAYAEGRETRRLGAGLAARFGYAVGEEKPQVPLFPLLHGWLQASVGLGHLVVKDAPLSPGGAGLVPHGRLELGLSAPVLVAFGLPDFVGVFVEAAPTDPSRLWRAGVVLGFAI